MSKILPKLKKSLIKPINKDRLAIDKTTADFLKFLKKSRTFQFNLFLVLLIFLLFPTQNKIWYRSIPAREPVVREPLAFFTVPKDPIVDQKKPFPVVSARGIYLVELDSMSLLYAKNPDQHFYPASTTKIVSAIVALDNYTQKEVVTVPYLSTVGQVLGIQSGEQYYFNDLLYGLLVQSGNDVAMTLAQNYPGGLPLFVAGMNRVVANLSLEDTNFTNPIGLDDWRQYTSPHDLAVLAKYAWQNSDIARAVATKEYDLSDLSGQHTIHLENINQLLGEVDGMVGIKTGWTEMAGECLVSLVEKDGQKVLGVVLNSADRFGDTKKIIAWVYDNYYFSEK